MTGADQYTVWSTDSNGNYLSNIIGVVSGTSTALESLETTFHQDLNGDGTIGVPTAFISIYSARSFDYVALLAVPMRIPTRCRASCRRRQFDRSDARLLA